MRRLLLVGMGLLMTAGTLGGCASYFKRKECEKTNWFEYGQKVAMEGRRVSGDTFVGECRKVEAEFSEADLDRGFKQGMAKYCQPDTVFDIGRRGDFYSSEMCDGENPRLLEARHKEGVKQYCQKSNGYTAGAAGKPYNRICPKDLEGAFIPEFNRGRKKYLRAVVTENEKRVLSIDREILDIERDRNMKAVEMQRLSGGGVVVQRQYNPLTRTYTEQTVAQPTSEEQKRLADNVRWDIDSLERKIRTKRDEQSTIREENRKAELEIVALDEQAP